MYDYKVISTEVYDDGSASAICNLKVHIPIGNGQFVTREVQEVGAWETYPVKEDKKSTIVKAAKPPALGGSKEETAPTGEDQTSLPVENEELIGRKWNMSKANLVASAASRGLLRCMMRLFGFGIDLYANDDISTNKGAFEVLVKMGRSVGLDREEIKHILRYYKFNPADLANHYQDAYACVISVSYMKMDGDMSVFNTKIEETDIEPEKESEEEQEE